MPNMKIETLRWFNNRLEMIDQRILPAAFEYLSYDSAVFGGRGHTQHGGARRAGHRCGSGLWRGAGGVAFVSAPSPGQGEGWDGGGLRERFYPLPSPPPARGRGWFGGLQSGHGSRLYCAGGQPPDGGESVLGVAAHAQDLGGRCYSNSAAGRAALAGRGARDSGRGHPHQQGDGGAWCGLAQGRGAGADALQRGGTGDGGVGHCFGSDSLGSGGGQEDFGDRRRDSAFPARCTADGVGDGAGKYSGNTHYRQYGAAT